MTGTVHFTGLVVEPDDILRPRVNRGIVPIDWSLRHVEIPVLDSYGIELWRFEEWLAEQFDGCFAILSHHRVQGLMLIIAFELPEDAALFVLMDGAGELLTAIRAAKDT